MLIRRGLNWRSFWVASDSVMPQRLSLRSFCSLPSWPSLLFSWGLSPTVNNWFRQPSSTSLFTACRHRKKRADLFQLSLFIREGRLSQRIPPLTTPHPPAQQTSLWVPWTALDYLTIHHLWEAGKASISYFYLIYWEFGSSKKGWGRKSCLIGLPHIGWRIEDLFWSVFLYCVKI